MNIEPTADPLIDIRVCPKCNERYPSWGVSSFMTCERCRGKAHGEEERQALLLQLSEAKDTIMAEAMRAKMLNTVHQVALRQNTAMLELADHYTGSLWPEEVQRAAKEILKAAKEATSEKPKGECGCYPGVWCPLHSQSPDVAEKRKCAKTSGGATCIHEAGHSGWCEDGMSIRWHD